MRRALLIVLVARAADAAPRCEWRGAQWCQHGPEECVLETSLPQGCPLHLVVPADHGLTRLSGSRGTGAFDITPKVASTPYELDVDMMVDGGCKIDHVPTHMKLAQLTIDLPGVVAGDRVRLLSEEISIGPAGTCPQVAWPTSISASILPCDLMPCAVDGGVPPTAQPTPQAARPARPSEPDEPRFPWELAIVAAVVVGGVVVWRLRR